MACFLLHNICIDANLPIGDENDDDNRDRDDGDDEDDNEEGNDNDDLQGGNHVLDGEMNGGGFEV